MNQVVIPEEQTGLLPWPSLGKQQFALAFFIGIGALSALFGYDWPVRCLPEHIHEGGVIFMALGLLTVFLSIYAGWKTRWLTRPTSDPIAKVGGSIALMLGVVLGTMIVLSFLAMLFLGRPASECS